MAKHTNDVPVERMPALRDIDMSALHTSDVFNAARATMYPKQPPKAQHTVPHWFGKATIAETAGDIRKGKR